MNLEPEKWSALLDAMEAEKAAVADEITVASFGPHQDGIEFTTRHGEHWHRVTCPTGGMSIPAINLMIEASVSVHARRMPKHMEFQALAKDVAA